MARGGADVIAKIALQTDENEIVTIPLGYRAFSYYDPDKKSWLTEARDFQNHVGPSSRDIRLRDTFKLAQTSLYK